MYNINCRLEGIYKLDLVSPENQVIKTVEQKNMILDGGFNQILSGISTGFVYVGAGGTPVQSSQSSLEDLLHKGQITQSNWRNVAPFPDTTQKRVLNLDNGTFKIESIADLGFGSFVGSVSEIGFRFNSDVPNNLFSRTVLNTPVDVPTGYKLIVNYTISITVPTVEVIDNFTLRDTIYTYTIRPNISNTIDVSSILNQGGITYYADNQDTHFFNYGFTQTGSTVKLENAKFTYETDLEYTNIGNNTNYRLDNTLETSYSVSVNTSSFYIQYAFTDLYKTQSGTNPNIVRTPTDIKAIGFPFCSGLLPDGSQGNMLPAYIVEFEPALNSSDFKYAGNFRITFNK
jgi:hypothetical protein